MKPQIKRPLLLALLFLFFTVNLWATHNHSGEITFQKTGGLGITATIITYTNASAVNADRDTLTICWGDGSCEQVVRSNGEGGIIAPNLKKNTYTGFHTYAAEGIYRISMTDPNRSAGIINVNPPSSDNIPFHIEAMVRMLPDAAQSTHSPVFLEAPVDRGFTMHTFEHVPNAFDADGDSLVYELAKPMQGPDSEVPNYYWPNEINPDPGNVISMDPATGILTWQTPFVQGDYCIAIVVRAYRNGVLVEEIRRDLFIEIEQENNNPPYQILNPNFGLNEIVDLTVGETIYILVNARDQDPGQQVTRTATSGLFEDLFLEKATYNGSANADTAVFAWAVKNEHIREQPYQVVFKVKDDFEGDGAASFRIVRFRVKEVTGVHDATLPGLSIFPNPNTGVFNVQLPDYKSDMYLRVIDIQGQINREIPVAAGTKLQPVRLNDVPVGVYLLQCVSEGKVLAIQKMMKE
jgi:hypothetical protein